MQEATGTVNSIGGSTYNRVKVESNTIHANSKASCESKNTNDSLNTLVLAVISGCNHKGVKLKMCTMQACAKMKKVHPVCSPMLLIFPIDAKHRLI